ncbi:MAG: urea ABC transporter ATP-binding subunit UrtE [Acidimicrobiales bacterium]
MLSVENLDVAYRRTQVLFDVSVDVPDGGLVCVMGRNGVGKTTLLNAIMGVLKPRSGQVMWEGRDITTMRPHERVRAGFGYVPQGHATFPQLTVAENLSVVVEAGGRATDRTALDDALDLFPRLKTLLSRRAGFLSGGQAQQLAFARALVTRPRLLLLDEPTEGIQPSIILEIEDAIAELHRTTSLSILLVEQYVEFALRLAERYVVLDAGEVVDSGATADLGEETVRRLLSV